MAHYLDDQGLAQVWAKIKQLIPAMIADPTTEIVDDSLSNTSVNPVQNKVIYAALDNKVDKVSGKGLSTNDYTTTEKNKLAGIAAGAEVNQNAFSNIVVGETIIAADEKTDTLTITAGSNVTLTPNANNDSIIIAASHPTFTAVTGKPTGNQTPGFGSSFTISQISQATSGQISAVDKTVTIPNATATTSAAGLMSSSDKTKLNGIASGAEVNQNAFSNVIVGEVTVAAGAKTDTLNLVAGSDKVAITADASTNTITIDASGAVTGVKGNSESSYRTGNVNITKANIGLGNVDNTSDANKPISTATQTALDAKADKTATVSNVAYDSTNKKITKTINGTTSDVVTVATLKTALNLAKGDVGLGNVDNTADANKNVLSATKLTTARTIDGVSFDGTANITHYGTCGTAAATTAKVVDCTGFTLATGARIAVKFTVTNTGAVGSLTLNVNGTGAKSIKYRGSNLPSAGTLTTGRVYEFVYDGTNYELIGDLDTNSTYTAASVAPLMDGTAAVGTSAKYAREDHVHPTDTTRAAVATTVTSVAYDSTNKKITKTINGSTTDVVTVSTLKADLELTKSDVGLGNVDNTADANKTVSKANTLTNTRYLEGVAFNGSGNTSYYATCPTAAATVAKVATITPAMTFSLVTGARVIVNFTYAIGVASATLNVNSTGAKAIYYNGSALAANLTDAGGTYEFVYNGTQWELIGDLDTNGSYTSFTGKPTANQTPSFGGTFTIQQISQNTVGQVSGTDRTVTIPSTVASASGNGLMSSTMFSKLNALPDNATLQSTYATKSDIASMYKYKGSVATAANLPTSGQTTGDVYNIEAASSYGGAGMNVAWNGTAWDPLGEIFTITSITSTEIDEICV